MVREDSNLAHAEATLRQLQVGDFQRVAGGGVLEIEVAAKEKVRVGVVRGRGGKGLEGWGTIVGGGVKRPNGEP